MTTQSISWTDRKLSASWHSIPSAAAIRAENRRIVLVDLFWTRDKDPRVPLGHASLLAALQNEPMLDARSVVCPVNKKLQMERIADEILLHTDGLGAKQVDIAIGAYIWNEPILKELLPHLRSRAFRGRIILGGPQISYVERGLEALYPEVDVFIRGQAEVALRTVALTNDRAEIPGVHYAGDTDRGEQAISMIAALPSPLLSGLIDLRNQDFLRWETRRGCQFNCSFCQHRNAGAKNRPETFPPSRIMEEIDLICRGGVKEVAMLDPVFNEDTDHAVSVLKRFADNGFRGRIELQCRVEMVKDEFLDAVQLLDVCLEFGLQTIHKVEEKAIGRRNSLNKVDAILAKVRQRGIKHEVSLIYGLPEQTLASFTESVQWCLERKIPVIKAFPLLLLRGTKLELERDRWQMLVEDDTMPEVVESSTFSRRDWEVMQTISQALSITENYHPSIDKLLALASVSPADRSRWQPELGEVAQ